MSLEISSVSSQLTTSTVSSKVKAFSTSHHMQPGQSVAFNVIQNGLCEDVEVEVFSLGMNRHDTPDMSEIAKLILEVEHVLIEEDNERSLTGFETDLDQSQCSDFTATPEKFTPLKQSLESTPEPPPKEETLDEMIASFETGGMSTDISSMDATPINTDDPLLRSIPVIMPSGEKIMMPSYGERSPAEVEAMRKELAEAGMGQAMIDRVVNAGFTSSDLCSLRAKCRGTNADKSPEQQTDPRTEQLEKSIVI